MSVYPSQSPVDTEATVLPTPLKDSQGRQIIFIDASSLKDSGCLRKFYWSAIKGWTSTRERTDHKIAYGSAFHKFAELWYGGRSLGDSVTAAIDYYSPYTENGLPDFEFRTIDHLYRTCRGYAERYPRENDGIEPLDITALEQKFSFPYWQNDKYVIMLCGTMDLIGKYHGIPCIIDHKTTSAYPKNFFNGYEMDLQLLFYSWFDNHIRDCGETFLPVLVNGIFIKKPTIKAEEAGNFDGAAFERSSLIQYSREHMEQFKIWLYDKLTVIVEGLERPNTENWFYTSHELSFCRTPFGLCKYFNICQLPMSVHEQALRSSFVENQYNPLRWRD